MAGGASTSEPDDLIVDCQDRDLVAKVFGDFGIDEDVLEFF